MALLGQASGGWTESSSALRILNLGIRNSIGVATDDAFTQANPVGTSSNVSAKVDVTKVGVLSGSVAFVRPDIGSNYVGGPGTSGIKTAIAASTSQWQGYRALGIFINSAAGNPYENTPGVASGVLPYVSGMGTYGNALYETFNLNSAAALTYIPGVPLIASLNGFLMPLYNAGSSTKIDLTTNAAEKLVRALSTNADARVEDAQSTVLGIVKMIPDAVQTELVFDARV